MRVFLPLFFILAAALPRPALCDVGEQRAPVSLPLDYRQTIDLSPEEQQVRRAAEKKIADVALLYEVWRARTEANNRPVDPANTEVRLDENERALIRVQGTVTTDLTKKIESAGGTIVSIAADASSLTAWMPLLDIVTLCKDPAVRSVIADNKTSPEDLYFNDKK